MIKLFNYILLSLILVGCAGSKKINSIPITPKTITEQVVFDTDDPAIWINPNNQTECLIVGTDKKVGGGLYLYNLDGKILKKHTNMARPNNVDVEYGLKFNGKKIDIAVATERKTNKIRIFSLPDFEPIDNGGLEVFEGETQRDPMGISLYKNPKNQNIEVVVGRKTGPSGEYLWQYQLYDNNGKLALKLLRKFGKFSGKKEIESIVVDDEAGFIYYSDEMFGVRKYYADSEKGNQELALFGGKDFKQDLEGISIYPTSATEGYLIVSNQQNNSFVIYNREGGSNHQHKKIAEIKVSAEQSDGSEVTNFPFLPNYPKGFFVAMSNGKVFHIYDWRDFEREINRQKALKK